MQHWAPVPTTDERTPAATAAASRHAETPQPARFELDARHADIELEAILTARPAEADSLTTTGQHQDEPLWQLAARYQRTLDALHDRDITARAQQALVERAPAALDAPATDALLHRLRDAENTGWAAEDAIAAITNRGLYHARDPAAVLHSRLTHALRTSDTDNAAHTEVAVTDSGTSNTTGPSASDAPAVPVLAEANPAALARHSDLAVDLDQLRTAITERSAALRRDTANDPPDWIASLGPRPTDPTAAHRWDAVAGSAAAYRDTYRVTTTDPATPLGPNPGGHGPRAQAWQHITDQWRTTMTSFGSSHYDRNQAAIDDLAARIHTGDHAAETTDRHLYDLEHQAATRAAETTGHDDQNRYYEDLDEHRNSDLGSGLHY